MVHADQAAVDEGQRHSLGVGGVVREVARQAVRDDILGLSAELAYRFFIALFPFFIALAAVGGIVATTAGIENPASIALETVGDMLPAEGTQYLEDQLRSVIENASPGQLIASSLLAILVATSGTNAVIKGLNRAYDVKEHRPFWRRYLTALLITLGAGTAVVISMVLLLPFRFVQPSVPSTLATTAIALSLLVAAGTLLFRVGPSVKLPIRVVMPGAALFAALSAAAAVAFGIYVSEFADYASTYGVLAGVVIVLVWFYVSSLILLVSAETNQVVHAIRDPEDVAFRRAEAEREGKTDFHPDEELRSYLPDRT